MVGRELHMLCPQGEDHQGEVRGGGGGSGRRRWRMFTGFKSLIAKMRGSKAWIWILSCRKTGISTQMIYFLMAWTRERGSRDWRSRMIWRMGMTMIIQRRRMIIMEKVEVPFCILLHPIVRRL